MSETKPEPTVGGLTRERWIAFLGPKNFGSVNCGIFDNLLDAAFECERVKAELAGAREEWVAQAAVARGRLDSIATMEERAEKAEAQLEEAKREIDIYVADAQANANHVFRLEQQLAEAKRKAADLVERLRARWPHIEVAWIPLLKDDKRTRVDPGPPTCLRCALEEVIGEGR